MRPNAHFRITNLALLWLICLSGCQAVDSGGKWSSLSKVSEAKPLRFAKKKPSSAEKQTADLEFAMGRTLEADGDVDLAIEAYRSAVQRDPSRADALVRQAILFDQQGRFGESAKLYQQALEANPGNPDIFADAGYSYYLQNRLPEAETNLRQAIALDGGHQRAHNNLGLVLARRNQPREALVQFRRAGCSRADAHANVAFAMLLERRFDAARDQYRQALAVDPTSSAAHSGLEDLEAVLTKAAARSAEPVARAVPGSDVPTPESTDEIRRAKRPRPDVFVETPAKRDEWFGQELNETPGGVATHETNRDATAMKPRRISWMVSAATSDP